MNEGSFFLCKWWGGKCECSLFLCKWWEPILASVCEFETGQTKMADSKMAKSKMAEFKIAVIMKLSENEWVKVFLCKWWNQSWQVWVCLRGKNEICRFQDSQVQDGRNQDGCHNQVEWEWMSLNQIELVWVRVRMEGECFWVNPKEDNKVYEFQQCRTWNQDGRNSRWQNSWWLPSSSWIKNELVWVRLN